MSNKIANDMYLDFLVTGKSTENDNWVEGFYACFNSKEHRIYTGYAETDCGDYYPSYYTVIPETVRKYTRLNDKNDKKIFNGDIVTLSVFDRDDEITSQYTCVVIFNKLGVLFEDVKDKNRFWLYATSDIDTTKDVEVIGNRIDNPELLK